MTVYKTPNGTRVRHTGTNDAPRRYAQTGEDFFPKADGDLALVQIMPPVPQRFEFVRLHKLTATKES